jgi:hypothetical protein
MEDPTLRNVHRFHPETSTETKRTTIAIHTTAGVTIKTLEHERDRTSTAIITTTQAPEGDTELTNTSIQAVITAATTYNKS